MLVLITSKAEKSYFNRAIKTAVILLYYTHNTPEYLLCIAESTHYNPILYHFQIGSVLCITFIASANQNFFWELCKMEIIFYGEPNVAELTEEEQKIFFQTIYERLLELAKK